MAKLLQSDSKSNWSSIQEYPHNARYARSLTLMSFTHLARQMLGEEVQTKGKLMNSVPGGEIQLMDQNDTLHRNDDFDLVELSLGPTNHPFKKACLSVCPLVNRLVRYAISFWAVSKCIGAPHGRY